MTTEVTSDTQIRDACPGITTWTYRELADVLELPRRPFALLYETEPGFGHWVAVLDTPEGIEHFDSYGLRPDDEQKWIPKQYRQELGAGSPHLVRLLLRTGKPINYSEFRLQGPAPAATCGKWVAIRCRNRDKTAKEFAKNATALAKAHGITPDELVVLLMAG